ncbi:MAG: hypothetical protein PHS46_08605, partial [Candidatus Omnitrophica bacterium]|nr:hypothetical protein [Candidatus Omnitrophota bacterium]
YYTIDVSTLLGNVNLANIKNLAVIVEGDNKTGNIAVDYTKNATMIPADPTKTLINVNIPASSVLDPTLIALKPSDAVGSASRTAHGMAINGYDTKSGASGGWIGADLSYTAAQNLTGQTIVIGVMGTEGTVKFEISDNTAPTPNKSSVYLSGVSSTTMQYYSIDLSKLSGTANLANIKGIAVIVEGDNKTGDIAIDYTPKTISSSNDSSKTAADVSVPVNSLSDPAATVVKPTDVVGVITKTTYGMAINNYDTKSGANGGWIGANLNYTVASDFTGKTIVIGLMGTESTVKLELSDSLNNNSAIYLANISSTAMKYYTVDVSTLLGNVNLANIKNLAVIVEGDNKTGNIAIDYTKNATTIPADPTKTLINVNIPASSVLDPTLIALKPSDAVGSASRTAHGMAINGYDTKSGASGGWIGADLSYTAAQNLTGQTIVIGVMGTEGTVKFEISDNTAPTPNKSSVYLSGVSSTTMQYYSIDLSKLSGTANLANIKGIAVIVEGDNKTGDIAIDYTPKTISSSNDSSKTAADVSVPVNSLSDPAATVVKPTDVVGVITKTTYGMAINNYDTKSGANGGWIGANLNYTVASDFTGKTIVIGLMGTESTVKLELSDSLNNNSAIYLANISSTAMKYYTVDVSTLLGNVNLANIKNLAVIVEGDNKTGNIAIDYMVNPAFISPSTIYTSEDINLPSQNLYSPGTARFPDNNTVTANVDVTQYGLKLTYDTNPAVGDIGKYTSPTNIGLSMTQWLLVARGDLAVAGVSQQQAFDMLSKSVTALSDLPAAQKWNGLYYTYVFVNNTPQKDPNTSVHVISQADNGNLAASLAAVIGAYKAEADASADPADPIKLLVNDAQAILNGMDWTKLVDTASNKMYLALDIDSNNVGTPQGFLSGTPYYADNIFDELRLGVIFGIVQNNINQATWTNLGKNSATCSIDGGVSLNTLKSGNGAMFQAFLPSIFFKETSWSEDAGGSVSGFGAALKNFALIQDYFARTNGLPSLLSSSMDPYTENGYDEFGVAALATYPASENVCAPYASALAYLVDPSLAINWLDGLAAVGADTSFGFKDAIAVNGNMSNRKLALDDAMIVLALQGDTVGNYVENYFTDIGKIDTVKNLYKNALSLSDQSGAAVPLTAEQENLRKALQAKHFLAFKDIVDTGTGWVYDHFNIQSGWAAGSIVYDQAANLSGMQNIIVGLKGNNSRVKVEVKDNLNHAVSVYLEGVDPNQENIFAIPVSLLQSIDLTHVKYITFVVEAENKTGVLWISRTPDPLWISASTTLTSQDINIPGQGVDYPAINSLINITTLEASDRGMKMVYNIPAGGAWAGAGFAYGISGGAASKDLSGLSELIFGVQGTPQRVKLEIKDEAGASASVYLDGIESGSEKIWSIPTSSLHGINLAKVSYLYFIVEGDNQNGTLFVNRVKASQWIAPAPAI